MQAVKNDAHALGTSIERRDAEDEKESAESAPAASHVAKGENNRDDNTEVHEDDSEPDGEGLPRPVAIANCPADEVGVELVAEGVFDGGSDGRKGGGVGGLLKCDEKGLAARTVEVEFSGCAVREVVGHNPVDFLTERLDSD